MRRCWAFAGAVVLTLSGAAVYPAHADDGSLYQECCWRCRHKAACCPPCTSCYPPTVCYVPRRCGPIRRLLGLCCPRPVAPCAPCCPAPVAVAGPTIVPPPPALVPSPAPGPAVLPAVPPAAAPAPPPQPAPVPPPQPQPVPPVSGTGVQRPLAPITPQTLTPQMPAPARLDHFVTQPGRTSHGPVEAVPATRFAGAP
jgi:hypothetical protein